MIWLLPLTIFLPLLALLPGGLWALPLLAPLTLWFPFRERVRERDYLGAWTLGMAWAVLLSAVERLKQQYTADPEGAKKLTTLGDKERAKDVNETELAAWASVVGMIMNLDETISQE